MQLLPAILREYKKIKNVGKDNVVIRVADSEDDISIEKANKKYQESFDSSIKPQIETDRTLIGGFQIQSNSKMIDASYKNALVKLYQNMTI